MAKLNYCPKCGEPLKDDYKVCPACGEPLEKESQEEDPFEPRNASVNQTRYQNSRNTASEGNTFGWAVLGFFFPIVGLILFLIWQTERPLSAKSAGTGALVSVVVGILGVMFMVTVAGASGMAY